MGKYGQDEKYPEAHDPHKCPHVVEGWSSSEDCLPDCPHSAMRGRQQWEDYLSPEPELPTGKHTKRLNELMNMSDEEYQDSLEEKWEREDEDRLKQKDKIRERY